MIKAILAFSVCVAVAHAFRGTPMKKSNMFKHNVGVAEQVEIATKAATPTWIQYGAADTDDEEGVPAEGTMMSSPVFKFMDFLFGIPIIHDVMFGVYRKQIVEKSEKMGLAWTDFMDEQWENLDVLKAKAKSFEDQAITIPDYYYAPIHAYKDGNLCWESALEEDLWSKLMIAPLYDGALDGDVQMRQKWLSITARGVEGEPKFATDLGCGTGLSMYMLDSKFPSLEKVTGVDLSTFKLAVCDDKKDMMPAKKAEKFNLYKAPAEASQVKANSQDLVSLCLVAHESPEQVTKNIFTEAYRILKPGGSFTMLDLDKENLENLLENPFVAAVYKRTEPYMAEFLALQPREALEEIGFQIVEVDQASRSHRVYVAQKPLTA
jgi:ubiquinone/menaquinone biosynthesis C-methylase UbiE